ncbi:MAG TPA: DUF2061 domain-containing protein [Cyclobacteriaceae bacterium]|nr:DUF2061 domain-containing protein [Cyclobacteriaceae bacterium]
MRLKQGTVYMTDSHLRSVTKGVTWRITATMDTILLAYIVTGTFSTAVKIGLVEVMTKIALYYFHERMWNVIPFGRIHGVGPTHARSLVKGISWRFFGTMDTIVISYIVTGTWVSAFAIGGFELITKVIIYYIHERVWGKIKWGRIIAAKVPVRPEGHNGSTRDERVRDKEAILP